MRLPEAAGTRPETKWIEPKEARQEETGQEETGEEETRRTAQTDAQKGC